MKLLYANDGRGEHAPSWYKASCSTPKRSSLESNTSADTCIIGAGFTGLSAALCLAQQGKQAIVLDAHRIGWGASGRNGGQLGSGYNQSQIELEKSMGKQSAHELWAVTQEAKAFVHKLCQEHDIDIEYHPGIVTALHRKRGLKELHDYCTFMNREYHYDALEPLNRSALKQRVDSEGYFGGCIDHDAGHVHPLKMAHSFAVAAEKAGAIIHELSEVTRIEPLPRSTRYRVVTPSGSVVCENVVLACNGYVDDLSTVLNKRVMPINNFIVVTEPLGEQAEALLPYNNAVADSRFVVNYFRRVSEDRLLFGGGENYSYRFPKLIERSVRKAMLGVFPQLENARIDYSWGGTLAITRSRLPYVGRLAEGFYTAGGYSGHGVALAAMGGTAIGEHIGGMKERFDLLGRLPGASFPGGKQLRPTLLALAMTGYSWLDRL
ncbi:MAG: NAD(P)/FAD-dependent oxidoreductase [Granulosicoccus sp.]